MYAIYKNTDFQYTYSAAITVIDGGVPKTLGVWQIIEKWVEWRRSVIEKEYKFRLEGLYASVAESRAFMEIPHGETVGEHPLPLHHQIL